MTREEKLSLLASKDSKKMLWSEFTKAVLDFQLQEHEKFLHKFRALFKTIDTDNNGVLNEVEFTRLVREIAICDSDAEVNYFLQVIDPYNNQQVTFSEIVHLFSAVRPLTPAHGAPGGRVRQERPTAREVREEGGPAQQRFIMIFGHVSDCTPKSFRSFHVNPEASGSEYFLSMLL